MRVLMCPPSEYNVSYEINPWVNIKNQPNKEKAWDQWHKLFEVYQKLGLRVFLLRPVCGLPDMVFTANACWGRKGNFVISNFCYPQRRKEAEYYKGFLKKQGFKTLMYYPGAFSREALKKLKNLNAKNFL